MTPNPRGSYPCEFSIILESVTMLLIFLLSFMLTSSILEKLPEESVFEFELKGRLLIRNTRERKFVHIGFLLAFFMSVVIFFLKSFAESFYWFCPWIFKVVF